MYLLTGSGAVSVNIEKTGALTVFSGDIVACFPFASSMFLFG